MRKVHVKLYVDAILTMDDGVELSDALDCAEPSLHIQDDRVTEIDCQIMNHEVTDSK